MTYWEQWRVGNAEWKRTRGKYSADIVDAQPSERPSRYSAHLCFIASGVWLLALAVMFK